MEPSSIVYSLTAGAVFAVVGLARGHRERRLARIREKWQCARRAVVLLRGQVSPEFVRLCRRESRQHPHGLEHVRRELRRRFALVRDNPPVIVAVPKSS